MAVAGLLVAVGLSGCSRPDAVWPDHPGPRVMTSFPPLYSFATNVAGDDANVLCLLTSTGPHHYGPSTRDALKLHEADLFVINGLAMDDHFATHLRNNSGNPGLRLLRAGERLPEKQRRELDKSDQNHEACSCCAHGIWDPHVWLGIPEAILMVEAIRDDLKAIDPEHAAGYDQRAAAYITRLKNLQQEGLALLQDKKERKLITFHDSLFYFARSFDLEIAGSIQFSAGDEPSPQRLAKLVQVCQDKGVRLLAVEPQYPTNTSAGTLLNELHQQGITDAAFVVIDPMETVMEADLTPDFYERRMRENLHHLAQQLR
jgi:ABC-type Zn uptake system ZnuABC Zn-binding protein ZnuA